VSLGYWLAVKASNLQGEHDKFFGYEEFCVKALTKPCALVNPIQDDSPSINLSQERGKKTNTRPSGNRAAVGYAASEALLYAKRSCGFVSVASWTYVE
jgi:hypothetical protein